MLHSLQQPVEEDFCLGGGESIANRVQAREVKVSGVESLLNAEGILNPDGHDTHDDQQRQRSRELCDHQQIAQADAAMRPEQRSFRLP